MKIKLFLLFILFQTICSAQMGNGIEKRYYKNGEIKCIAIKCGIDTIDFKSYYKNGQLKDSVWLYIPKRREIPLGVEKTYYENGTISSITYYKNGRDAYISYSYGRNGKLSRFEQKPTGLTKFYNKNGKQIREYDYHNSQSIYVSKGFRKGRHLKNSSYIDRIKTRKALLISDKKKVKLCSGVLISLVKKTDTVLLTHCQIEGFSKDSIYLSKFHYNEIYAKEFDLNAIKYDSTFAQGFDSNILKYDSTFALGFDQLDTVYYARHNNRKRLFGALTAMIVGAEFAIPSVIICAILPFVGADAATVAYIAGSASAEIVLFYYGKYLYKTAVPKKYDMKIYKILIQN